MEPFETVGRFWLEGMEPGVPGMLRYGPTEGARLTVFETLLGEKSLVPGRAARYPVIRGVVHTPPSGTGTHLTLLNCLQTKLSFGMEGTSTEECVATRAVIGDEFVSADQEFTCASIALTNLSHWLGMTGLEQAVAHTPALTVTIKSNRPEPLILSLEGVQLEFGTRVNMATSATEIRLGERAVLEVRPTKPAGFAEYERAWLMPLASLLTLATDEVARIDEFQLRVRESPRWPPQVSLLPQEARRPPRSDKRPLDMLFTREDVAADLQGVLGRWFELTAAKRRFVQLFFSLLEVPPIYIEVRFAMLVQAVDLYSRPDTLREFVEKLPAEAEIVAGVREAFVKRLSVARERLWEDTRPVGHEYFVLAGALEWLLKLALLRDIGALTKRATASRQLQHAGRLLNDIAV